jgi:hypothetical protein
MLSMPAGRDMDALVAEKLMGWKYHPKWNVFTSPNGLENDGSTIPNYSTDIAAAWKVVEKMTKIKGYGFSCDWVEPHYLIEFEFYTNPSNLRFINIDSSIPIAICRAALLTTN